MVTNVCPEVSRGLVLRERWINLILSGRKTWEMRGKPTRVRGTIGLIEKGSGTIVGLARLIGCGSVLDQASMRSNVDKHCIPLDEIPDALARGWSVPWFIADARRLLTPTEYHHRSGAVTWVKLDEETLDARARAALQIEAGGHA